MRLNLLFTFLLLSLASVTTAQKDFTKVYFPLIYRAELAILKEEYPTALRLYDSAFRNVPKPFARDYFNAAICASKVADYQTAFNYCDSLIAKGVSKKFFTTYGSFRPLWETAQWTAFLESYDQKYRLYNHKDTVLPKLFVTLDMRDQEFRRKAGSYRLYSDTIGKIDSSNIAQLVELTQTIGFPNENMTARMDPTSYFFPGYLIFLHHAEQLAKKQNKWYNPLQDYLAAIKKGELDPHVATQLLGIQKDSTLALGCWGITVCEVDRIRSKLMANKYTADQTELINKTRFANGLESLDDYYQKALFVLRDDRAKEFAFRVYEHLIILFMDEEAQCEKLKQSYIEIE